MSRRLLTVVVALAALAVAGPAWAHVEAPTTPDPVLAVFGPETLSPDIPASPGPWLLAAGIPGAPPLPLPPRPRPMPWRVRLLTFWRVGGGRPSPPPPTRHA